MVLPNFDDEMYMNRPKEDQDAATDVVAPSNVVVQLTEEVGQTTMEVMPPSTEATQLTEDAGQITAEGTGEDAAGILFPS